MGERVPTAAGELARQLRRIEARRVRRRGRGTGAAGVGPLDHGTVVQLIRSALDHLEDMAGRHAATS